MSRRSVTTIVASVKLRVPPGSSATEVMDFIARGLRAWKAREYPEPLKDAEVDTDSMIIKLEKKETVYL